LKIFGSKRDKLKGGWRKLHNEKLHNLSSSPNITIIIKSRRMQWAGHVTSMRREYTQVFSAKTRGEDTTNKKT
jgi:hypothetical protein